MNRREGETEDEIDTNRKDESRRGLETRRDFEVQIEGIERFRLQVTGSWAQSSKLEITTNSLLLQGKVQQYLYKRQNNKGSQIDTKADWIGTYK